MAEPMDTEVGLKGGDEAALAQQLEKEAKALNERVRALREDNLNAEKNRISEGELRKLDSTVKKNTAFTKKVKAGTIELDEARKLNLTKYVDELVAALAHMGEVKKADIPGCVELASLLHQRYAEFSGPLRTAMVALMVPPKAEDKDAVAVFRTTLRIFVELILAGVFPDKDMNGVTKVMKLIAKPDGEPGYISVIVSFLKSLGSRVLGVVSRRHRILADMYGVSLAPTILFPTHAEEVRTTLNKYYDHVAALLVSEHKRVMKRQRKNETAVQMFGSVADDKQEELAAQVKEYEKLYANVASLADLLDRDLPDLPEDDPDEIAQAMTMDFTNSFRGLAGQDEDYSNSLWEDRETAIFYEDITDLRNFVPEVAFRVKGPAAAAAAVPAAAGAATDEKKEEKKTEEDVVAKKDDEDKKKKEKPRRTAIDEDGLEYEVEDGGEDIKDVPDEVRDKDPIAITFGDKVSMLFERLGGLVNRDFVDKFAIDFCSVSNKGTRRRLAEELYNVSYNRLDLLPYYARLVATLNPGMPDIMDTLLDLLQDQFRFLHRKHPQDRIESKIKNIRFIGELTKFAVAPPGIALGCLSQLLRDFKNHAIDIACALLECCGRFLFRNPLTHAKMAALLDIMAKKKTVQRLDERQTTTIENAILYCNPPENAQIQRKVRPPLHEYVRKLLYKDLRARTSVIETILEKLRKCPWSAPDFARYGVLCFTRVWRIKYNNIASLASLLSGMFEFQPAVCFQVVDNVLEEIRIGMEVNHPEMSQRRVSAVKYLAELFNYRLVESKEIFSTLYSLVFFAAHNTRLDPSDSFIRIKLVCTILDTCGQFFDRGKDRKRLDCFLVYFQRYIQTKAAAIALLNAASTPTALTVSGTTSTASGTAATTPAAASTRALPLEVEFMVEDTFEQLRPEATIFDSLEQANAAVEAIEKEIQAKLPTVASSVSSAGQSVPDLASSDSSEDEDEAGHQGRGDVEGEEEDERDDQGAGQDGEDASVVLRGKGKGASSEPDPEDELFKANFDKMLASAAQARTHGAGVKSLDVAIPMHLRGKAQSVERTEDGQTRMKVVLLTKKKQQEVVVPVSASRAEQILKVQEDERRERERTKQFLHGYEERAHDDIVQELLGAVQITPSPAQGAPAPTPAPAAAASRTPQRPQQHNQQRGRGGNRGGNRHGVPPQQRRPEEIGEHWTGQPIFPTFK